MRLEYPIGKPLYETIGFVDHLRFSPQGDAITFLDHPVLGDDRGSVAFVDLQGNKHPLTHEWAGEEGLAWSADGREVWFTATDDREWHRWHRSLHTVSRSGRQRQVLSSPAVLYLDRAANHVTVRQSQFDLPELTPQTRVLARALRSCIVGSREVQAGLRNMLEACDEAARAAHSCDLRCIATQVLVSFAHSRPDAKVYVCEITEAIEGIQKIHGETGALEARRIGDTLRSLGIHSKRNGQGLSILLTENMRRQVHELARDFEVAPVEQGQPPCSLCAELLPTPGKTKVDIPESKERKGECTRLGWPEVRCTSCTLCTSFRSMGSRPDRGRRISEE